MADKEKVAPAKPGAPAKPEAPAKPGAPTAQVGANQGKPAKKKAGGGKMAMLAVIGLVVLVNAVIVGKVMIGSRGAKHASQKSSAATNEVGPKVALEEFLVNLSGNDHYLRATISLGLKKGLTEESVKDDTAPIRDAINSVLSSKKVDELTTDEGKERLKGEIKDRVNHELGDDKVARVYFTAFATQ